MTETTLSGGIPKNKYKRGQELEIESTQADQDTETVVIVDYIFNGKTWVYDYFLEDGTGSGTAAEKYFKDMKP